MIVALLVVVLIVGTSAVVFAQLSPKHGNAAGTAVAALPAGQWVSVLSGYQISLLDASPANPSDL